jgi:hypothetical protein
MEEYVSKINKFKAKNLTLIGKCGKCGKVSRLKLSFQLYSFGI